MKSRIRGFLPGTAIGAIQMLILYEFNLTLFWQIAVTLLVFCVGYIITALLMPAPVEGTTLIFNVKSIKEAEEITNHILAEKRPEES